MHLRACLLCFDSLRGQVRVSADKGRRDISLNAKQVEALRGSVVLLREVLEQADLILLDYPLESESFVDAKLPE